MNKCKTSPGILAVDDDLAVLETYRLLFADAYRFFPASSVKAALDACGGEEIDLAFLDIALPDGSGMDLIERVRKKHAHARIIMATATDSARAAVAALNKGAHNYITKPFDPAELLAVAEHELRRREARGAAPAGREGTFAGVFDNMIGSSPAIREVFGIITKIAPTDATVLISGESGTGKELVAASLHARSSRCAKPFIPINCATIPETLLESELFGYEKGSFTGAFAQKVGMLELAHEGTVFLDEISELRVDMQAKLLRALEERQIRRVGGTRMIRINVRIIAATNVDLARAVRDGAFRKDLYYRLHVVPIRLPPLRERSEDIPLLSRHFLSLYNSVFRKDVPGVGHEALKRLREYSWPGNIRELKNIFERVVALKDAPGPIEQSDLPPDILFRGPSDLMPEQAGTLREAQDNFQRHYIEGVLARTGGNQIKAARILGIHRNALFSKMRALGLRRPSRSGAV